MIKKKLLIFGSSGTLGKKIIHLVKKKFKIIKIDKKKLNFNEKKMSFKIKKILSIYNPDIIINASGVLGNNELQYQRIFNTNFGSNWEIIKFYCQKRIIKKVKIILIGSTSYKKSNQNYLLYSASKAALHSLYSGAKKNLRKKKISLLIYHPVRMRTKMIKNISFIKRNSGVNPEREAKKIIKII